MAVQFRFYCQKRCGICKEVASTTHTPTTTQTPAPATAAAGPTISRVSTTTDVLYGPTENGTAVEINSTAAPDVVFVKHPVNKSVSSGELSTQAMAGIAGGVLVIIFVFIFVKSKTCSAKKERGAAAEVDIYMDGMEGDDYKDAPSTSTPKKFDSDASYPRTSSDIYGEEDASKANDGPKPHSISSRMVGSSVEVKGYGPGILRYYGRHATMPGYRCGVELTRPFGKHDGVVSGYAYFNCKNKHGILVDPRKVTAVGGSGGGGARLSSSGYTGEVAPPNNRDVAQSQIKYLEQQLKVASDVYSSVPKKKPGEQTSAANKAFGKNRYADVLPYDKTRVVLNGAKEEDYVNASYVTAKAHTGDLSHVCCQGPTKKSVPDMWRMILQERTELIVMLAQVFEGGRTKCEQYWPEKEGEELTFGAVSIKTTRITQQGSMVITKLSVKDPENEVRRTVTHLQFTGWSVDHALLTYIILYYIIFDLVYAPACFVWVKIYRPSIPPRAGRSITHC